MVEVRKRMKSTRTPNPFDDGAEDRLCRMGLVTPEGEVEWDVIAALSAVYAGLLFDDLCDFYQDYSCVKKELEQFFATTETAEGRQKFLGICLQYDGLSQSLPNPIWWISGNQTIAGIFAESYIKHLKRLYDFEEVS